MILNTKQFAIVLDDTELVVGIDRAYVMLTAPGDSKKLSEGLEVEPLDVYDMSDPTDLRRLADHLENIETKK